MYGKVITMHLIGGTPDGCVACELSNWTGKAFRVPRHLLKTFGGDGELHRAGVYFLFGRDEAHIKFLENTIHTAALLAGRFRFENGNTPPRPRILTGALGYKVF